MKVFIENEAGSLVKHIHDEKRLELRGTETVSKPYPYPYGFVLNTTAEDGDNVDCFVITTRVLHRGDVVECEAFSLMEQIEDGEIDHKVLALIGGEHIRGDQVEEALADFCRHVFDHVPGKKMEIGPFCDAQHALDYVARHEDVAKR